MLSSAPGSRYLPHVFLLFAGSGCAALMYEIVWYQMLQLAIGSTTISMAFLLASFMGGLCLGSWRLPRYKTDLHPLRLFAAIEVGIAACGLVVLFALPLLDRVYIAAAGYGVPSTILRALLAAICLLPPTFLMGASLPAAARWIESTGRGVSWWGLLYGGNTAGAVFGCLFAGFYLLRVYNQAVGTYAAMLINLAVAAGAWAIAGRTPAQVEARAEEGAPPIVDEMGSRGTVYAAIALSGAAALGGEVVWTRLLGTLMGSTTYVFSIILAVFLIGLAAGSMAGAWVARTVRPRLALGLCQALLVLAVAWTALTITESLPYWPINPFLAASPWFTFQIDMARALWTLLPPALLWGASFPLALAAVAEPRRDPARSVSAIYAWNTLGAIIGALGVSLVLTPWIGTQNSQRAVVLLSAIAAIIALYPYLKRNSTPVTVVLAMTVIGAGYLVGRIHAVPGEFIAYGRQMPMMLGRSQVLHTAEGINSSVAITQWPRGEIYINVNGHVEATTEKFDMALQRMVGHLPALLHPNPKSVLGIGFGAGVSAGTFTRYPGIEKITICEIEPVIPPASTTYFAAQNYEVAKDPRTTIVFDDARHFLLTTRQKFDIVASDPLDVFAKGTAALYSKEYFDAVKAHLNPGGFFTLYIPLYESDEQTIKSELATFFAAFPNGTVWANTRDNQGYDMVFLARADALRIDLDEVEQRFARADYAAVRQSLEEIGVESPLDLLRTYTGARRDLGRWFGDGVVTRDRDLRLMYLAGWGINSFLADPLYREMLKYREIPRDLFVGSPEKVDTLLRAIEEGPQ